MNRIHQELELEILNNYHHQNRRFLLNYRNERQVVINNYN